MPVDPADILPGAPRSESRPREDRGLPPDQEFKKLAEGYLACQSKLWPGLVKAGVLLNPSDEVLDAMVGDFKTRHRTGEVNSEDLMITKVHNSSSI